MTTTLFHGARVRTGVRDAAPEDWLLVDDEVITGSGTSNDMPAADRVVDLDGATVVPGFCDAHVHLPATGLYLTAVDLAGLQTKAAIVAALRAGAMDPPAVLFATNLQDAKDPLTGADVDAAVGPVDAVVARADIHSCVVTSSVLAKLDLGSTEGIDRDEHGEPNGVLRERAAAIVWRWLDANVSGDEQARAVRAAVTTAYERGIVSVHEMFVAEWRQWSSLTAFIDIVADLALEVVVYPATEDVDRVAEMGLERVGGDLFLDGSIGSQTAWLATPYESAPPAGEPDRGMSYRSDEDLVAFFRDADARGMQTGVHAIGDAAIEQAISSWEKVAAEAGRGSVRAGGHRIEHFEVCSPDHIQRAADLALRISVQPAFDELWGGPDGMYAARLGWDRARAMNPFRSLLEAGLHLGSGSDAPVTPMEPLRQIAALRAHHVDDQAVSGADAMWMQTAGARRLARGSEAAGTLEAGAPADLAVLDVDPVTEDPSRLVDGEVLYTYVAGRCVWPDADRELE